jgi:hypothetical protein
LVIDACGNEIIAAAEVIVVVVVATCNAQIAALVAVTPDAA